MDHLKLMALFGLGLCACVGTVQTLSVVDEDGEGDGPDAGPDDIDGPGEPDAGPLPRYNSIRLIGRYEMPRASDVAATADANLVAVTSRTLGYVDLIDTSDKENPVRLSRIEKLGYSPDVQIQGSTLFVSHENTGQAPFYGDGVTIIDISDPSSPERIGTLDSSSGDNGLENCHNMWPQPERNLFYCASTTTGRVVIMSTDSPGTMARPQVLGNLRPPSGGAVHDMYALDDRLYVAWLDGGLGIYDISDPSSPERLGRATYNRPFTHTAWPNSDRTALYTTDEYVSGHLRIWDISDVSSPKQVGEYNPNSNAIIHNAELVDDYIFISYYTEGLKVLDAEDPMNPVEIGSHDFYDGPDGQMEGAWGVDPYPPYIFVSGMQSGLWIYEMERETTSPD